MPRVRLLSETDEHGNPVEIEVVGDWPSYDAVLEAHGYDASGTEYEVEDPQADLETAISQASNLDELKSALTSSEHPAQARGKGRGL